MGQDKTSGTTVTNTTSQATPTAEETALNKLQLEQATAAQPGTLEAQSNSLNLVNKLLTGSTDLPGYLKTLAGGVTEDQTQSMVNASMRDVGAGLNVNGLIDSGTGMAIAGRTAGDIRNQNAQFNIGALQNMLNLALSGQAQVQAPVQGATAQLGSSLAGLRSVNQSGTSSTTTSSMNPFLKSFQNSFGSTLGSGSANFAMWGAR
jgi:hypothetical protein